MLFSTVLNVVLINYTSETAGLAKKIKQQEETEKQLRSKLDGIVLHENKMSEIHQLEMEAVFVGIEKM